ncbi:hypothetical protein VNI00_008183 [Paramarasmius palmivorus]|uniref:F-box domain-containing protein n=1 Tax=Paramarasmius palmivorus TaxID=297713 RepID=A0AAW0CV75_9AGAR
MSLLRRPNDLQATVSDLPPTTYDFLFRDLSVIDLFRFSKVNQHSNLAVKEFFRRAYRVENILLPFFTLQEIRAFRILQYTYGVLISGSTALSFFEREVYPDADLDIYVDVRFCAIVAHFLIGSGYRYAPGDSREKKQPGNLEDAIEKAVRPGLRRLDRSMKYSSDGMADVFAFVKEDGSRLRRVELVASQGNPFQVILGFHSTVVMNIIGYTHAISLYPRSTFKNRISLKLYTNNERAEQARRKYQKRGWTLISMPDAASAVSRRADVNIFFRHLLDEFCWRIPLEPVEDFVPAPALNVGMYMILHSWKLDCIDRSNVCVAYETISGTKMVQSYCLCAEAISTLRSLRVDLDRCSDDRLMETLIAWYQAIPLEEDLSEKVRNELIRAYSGLRFLHASAPGYNRPNARSAQVLYQFLERVHDTMSRQQKIPIVRISIGSFSTEVTIGYPLKKGPVRPSHLHLNQEKLYDMMSDRITVKLEAIRGPNSKKRKRQEDETRRYD